MTAGHPKRQAPDCDVAIVGAGTVGLALALALAQSGLSTMLIGPAAPSRPGRTVALLDGSVRLLESLDAWSALEPEAAALKQMRIVDATGSLFRSPPVNFDAREIGRGQFGYNIPNDTLDRELAALADRQPGLTPLRANAQHFRFTSVNAEVAVEGHGTVTARLVVAADGRQSLARKSARIGARVRQWPQVALTAIFGHEGPHHGISTEFHTREGPFTLVPLPGSATAPHRSSLVWVMAPDSATKRRAAPDGFARLAEEQAQYLLGAMTLESAIGAFPITTAISSRLIGPRLVLAGEAAHALPPIGAQGLNLSLRDVAALAQVLAAARREGQDIGSSATLDRYASRRAGDVTLRQFGVDTLNGTLLSRSPLTDIGRGLGLAALGAVGPLRRAVMRRGLMPQE